MAISQRMGSDSPDVDEQEHVEDAGLDPRRIRAVIWTLRGLGAVAFVVGIIAGVGMLAVGGVTGLPFAMALTVAGAAGAALMAFCAANLELLMAIHERLGRQEHEAELTRASARAARPTARG